MGRPLVAIEPVDLAFEGICYGLSKLMMLEPQTIDVHRIRFTR
jgi:hypothetical protein